MRTRALIALWLVLVLASLTPLARLSPPDPTWFAGFWDDRDYDDVILLSSAQAMPFRRLRITRRVRRAEGAAAR